MPRPASALSLRELTRVRRFAAQEVESLAGSAGRITLYEAPRPGRLYVAGADFALGLVDGDRDTCAVYDRTSMNEGDGVAVQVAEAEGRWGDDFDGVLLALLRLYRGGYDHAFLVGERQVGLPVLRRLYKAGLRFLFHQRQEEEAGRRRTDLLGVHKNQRVLLVRNLRKAVAKGWIEPRSEAAIDEMGRLQFKDLPSVTDRGERSPDEDLRVKLEGASPDLTMAHAYAWLGLGEVDHFEEQGRRWPTGSYGALLGEDDDLLDQAPRTRGIRVVGRRRR